MTDALKEESRQMTKPDGEVTAEDARRAAREMLRRGATPDHLTTLARSCGDGSDVDEGTRRRIERIALRTSWKRASWSGSSMGRLWRHFQAAACAPSSSR